MNGPMQRNQPSGFKPTSDPYSDSLLRRHKHGPIRPMDEPTLLQRLFGRR